MNGPAGRRDPPTGGLDLELRRLYEKYGADPVPERLLELARQVEVVHRDARFPDDADSDTGCDR